MIARAPLLSRAERGTAALPIETFSNVSGGNTLYKALAHPLAADQVSSLLRSLRDNGPVVLYDPFGEAAALTALYDFSPVQVSSCLVQRIEDLDDRRFGCETAPVSVLPDVSERTLFIAAYDAKRLRRQIDHLMPAGMRIFSFDDLKLPEALLTDHRRYLNPLNFATNFAFFRDKGGRHTRITSANYWFGHGARDVSLWLRLYQDDGRVLAEWREDLAPAGCGFVIDSLDVRSRFGLGDFTGSLFMHVVGAAGHDVVKYALDTYGDDATELSSTHDANAWPADYYAGLPAPSRGETVILWIQNSHGVTIPAGSVALNPMGKEESVWVDEDIPPFGTQAVDVGALFPHLHWPQQLEIRAGRYFVRPRYEILGDGGRNRIAHVNVERTDLQPDPKLSDLTELLGKGYLLPAPVLPVDRWSTMALPTPMARLQSELPISVVLYDSEGGEQARRFLGRVPRADCTAVDLDELLSGADCSLPGGYGHVEAIYDFTDGGRGDGWLHGIFRYRDRASGHSAETSFGAHIYNTVITYRSEPQSYIGRPPGLSTRLFLRIAPAPLQTLMHLIYPASQPWHGNSSTEILLFSGAGEETARRQLTIPCGGSRLVYIDDTFTPVERGDAGDHAYVMVRDATCRLFGYHGLLGPKGAFSLDHMFGF